MPQLDALTYFSQFVYLLFTFVVTYYFLLTFVIPKMASTVKLRQKLNTLGLLKETISSATSSKKAGADNQLHAFDIYQPFTALAFNNWKVNTAADTHFKLNKVGSWLVSAHVVQLAQALRWKKSLSKSIVRKAGRYH